MKVTNPLIIPCNQGEKATYNKVDKELSIEQADASVYSSWKRWKTYLPQRTNEKCTGKAKEMVQYQY